MSGAASGSLEEEEEEEGEKEEESVVRILRQVEDTRCQAGKVGRELDGHHDA